MNIQRLRYFVAVVRAGNVSRAARALRVAQPAVSNRIRQLEADLGVVLLERRVSGVALTRAGAIFLPYAQNALEAFDRGRNALEDFASIARLAVGCTQTLGLLLAPRVIAEYRRCGLPAEIAVRQGSSGSLVDEVRSQLLDAALCYEIDDDTDLTVTPLFEHDLHVIGRPGLSIADRNGDVSFADLREVRLVLDPRNNASRCRINEAERARGFALDAYAEVELTYAKAELLLHHGCYALVPRPLFGEQIAAGTFQAYRLNDASITLQAKLVGRKEVSERIPPFQLVVSQVVDRLLKEQNTDLRPPGGRTDPAE